jgi:hypothetical protein
MNYGIKRLSRVKGILMLMSRGSRLWHWEVQILHVNTLRLLRNVDGSRTEGGRFGSINNKNHLREQLAKDLRIENNNSSTPSECPGNAKKSVQQPRVQPQQESTTLLANYSHESVKTPQAKTAQPASSDGRET